MEEHRAHPSMGHGEPGAVEFPRFLEHPARRWEIILAGQFLCGGGEVGIAEMAEVFGGLGEERGGGG